MSEPLVFTPGAAATAFNSVAAVWSVFEFVMNVRQRWRAVSGARHDPTFWVRCACIAASVLISQALGRTGHVLWPGGRLWPVVAGLVPVGRCCPRPAVGAPSSTQVTPAPPAGRPDHDRGDSSA